MGRAGASYPFKAASMKNLEFLEVKLKHSMHSAMETRLSDSFGALHALCHGDQAVRFV
jgi:hypothetical protein